MSRGRSQTTIWRSLRLLLTGHLGAMCVLSSHWLLSLLLALRYTKACEYFWRLYLINQICKVSLGSLSGYLIKTQRTFTAGNFLIEWTHFDLNPIIIPKALCWSNSPMVQHSYKISLRKCLSVMKTKFLIAIFVLDQKTDEVNVNIFVVIVVR